MISENFLWMTNHSKSGRRFLFRLLFEYLARKHQAATGWTQMNYGYADASASGKTIVLDAVY